MGNEVGEVRPGRQVPGIRGRGVEDDQHRAGLQVLLDAGGDLADMGVGDGENDHLGAGERLVDRHGVDAEAVLQPLAAGVADFDMANIIGGAAEIAGEAVTHLTTRPDQGDCRHESAPPQHHYRYWYNEYTIIAQEPWCGIVPPGRGRSWLRQGEQTSLLEPSNTSFDDVRCAGSPFNGAGPHRSGDAITIVVCGSMMFALTRQA